MSLKALDFSKLPSPVGRFRDLAKALVGAEPAAVVSEWYKALGLRQGEARERARRAVTTPQEWEAERQRLRADYQTALGPFPAHTVAIVDKGTIETKDLLIRKLLFSAATADNWVSANLYLPKHAASRLPAIVHACGHHSLGKAGYAARTALLARNGYAVLSFDLIGMGERQLVHHDSTPYAVSTQHNIIGAQMTLAGCTLGWFMVQEAMAAVTVLQGVPEVDAERIGITGSSGGGWLSVHAAALDERIKVVVPAASVSSLRYSIRPEDAEQTLFDMQALGLHYPDFIGFLICPRPIFIVANSHDIWNVQSTEYAFSETQRFYRMAGHGDRIRMKVWDKGHAYEADQVVEAVNWFNTHLKGDPAAPVVTQVGEENAPDIDSLQVSSKENLFADGCKTPVRVFREFARKKLRARRDLDGFLVFLKATVRVQDRVTWQELDRFVPGDGLGRRVAYSPDKGMLLPVDVLIPDRAEGVVILVDECGRRDDLDWQIRCMSEGRIVFRPDLRGWGETLPPEDWADWEGWSRNLYDHRGRALAALAQITGRNLVLDRTRDLIALLVMVEELAPGLPIALWGRRQAALPALFAALADGRFKTLTLERCLSSCRSLMETDLPLWRSEGIIYGLLRWGIDLPDLMNAYSGELVVKESLDAGLRRARGLFKKRP